MQGASEPSAGGSRRDRPVGNIRIETEGATVDESRILLHRTPCGFLCVGLGPGARWLRAAFAAEHGAEGRDDGLARSQ
jgi:hypothetical protein